MTLLLVLARCVSITVLAADVSSPPEIAAKLPPAAEAKVDFEAEILPILRERCWSCHGSETWEAGLRLDRREKILQGGDGGPVIVVGESAHSKLIHYVSGAVPDRQMPPDEEPLSARQIGLLRAWIDQGLDWPASVQAGEEPGSRHWAFQPIRKVAIPDDGSSHPVDQFINRQLQKKNVTPSPKADRAMLMRRLSLDLLGLIPTAEEVQEFCNDARPGAYERLVDRLLSSPHFGERWGRHWLDLARYADSDGYEKDLPRPHAYRYRDWVIQAFNADMPYDQFTVEQLAGDLLPNATPEQQMATGFHRQTLTNREGGADRREDRDKQLVDRTNTTGAVWMGLTVGCAQCHTHKYDPISQREYYELYAFFNAAEEVEIPAPTAWERQRYETALALHEQRRAPLLQQIEEYRRERLSDRLADWEQRIQRNPVQWTPVSILEAAAQSKATLTIQPNGSWLAGGPVPDVDSYTLYLTPTGILPTGLLLETVPDEQLPSHGAGRAPNGNFVLTEFKVQWRNRQDSRSKPRAVTLVAPRADYTQRAGTPQAFLPQDAFDGDSKTGWAVGGSVDQPHALLVELDWAASGVPPMLAAEDIELTVTLDQRYGRQHSLGCFRLLATTQLRPLSLPQLPVNVAEILKIAPLERTSPQQQTLLNYYAEIDPHMVELQRRLRELDAKGPRPPATKAMVFAASSTQPTTRIHLRGDFLSPGPEVQPAVFDVLNPLKSERATPSRLDLAHWLVSEEHPLTRRVAVNRIWQHLFGRGLVDPPDDFGLRGSPPSHPELLDWLASEFSRRGWSTKEMIRLIVTSDTYQRTSQGRPDLVERDPHNRWLSHQNRFRLSGEILRDVTLKVSGLLDEQIGGPSIRPPLPEGVASLGYANSVKWPESKGSERYRRGCYIFFQRTVPYPLLMTFDGPDSNTSCLRRERSNTPLQSLTLLNDPAFVECAQALGARLMREGGSSPSDRLHAAMAWTLNREPQAKEIRVLTQLYDEALHEFRANPERAGRLISQPAVTKDVPQQAAWTSVARILLNLDEFLNRE